MAALRVPPVRRGTRPAFALAFALALTLAACGGGGGGGTKGGDAKPTISGTVSAPGGQATSSVSRWLRAVGEAAGVLAPRSATVLPPAAGLPVALVALDEQAQFVSTVATTTTDANGFYSLPRPATFTPGLTYAIVAGGAANGLRAFATGTTVDVNPFTHVAWTLVVQEIEDNPGSALSDIPAAQVVGLVETVQDLGSSVDLTATTAAVIAALQTAIQTAEDTGGLLANLLEPGGFAGTVTGPGGAPLADVQVKVFGYPAWTLEARLRTDASGRYTAHLPAGQYIIVVVNDGAASTAASAWWTAAGGTALQNAAEPTTVADTLVRRDFALAAGGRVSGTITAEANGAPLAGVRVVLKQFDLGFTAIPVRTDEAGRYTINALPGAYYLEIYNDTLQPYASELYSTQQPFPNGANNRLAAQKLTVAAASSTTANASLATGQRLFGAVVDPIASTSVAGAVVRITDQATGSATSFSRTTDRNGTFALWLRPEPYTVRARGQTTSANLSSGPQRVDFAAPVGTITATLRHPGGAPAAGVFGFLHDAANLANGLFAWEAARADGALSLFVPTGVTSVVVQFRSDELPGATVVHPGPTRLFAGQRLLAPGAGNTLDLGTVTLPAGGVLTGTVRKSGVAKGANWVTIRSGGTAWTDVFVTISTLSDGSYRVVLPAGTYSRVCTLEPPGTGICDGAQRTGATWAYRDSVAVTAGNTTTLDLSYPGHSIAGAVSGAISSGVTLTLSGAASRTATSGPDGAYVFSNLENGSYTVTPSLAGYTFSPSSRNVTVNGGSVAAQNFTATAVPRTISGTVSGAVTAGVTVTLSGAASATTTTNAQGAYSFTGLAPGSYTVTPTLAGYTFSPPSIAVVLAGADATGRDFTASAVPVNHAISGTVSGAVAAGVTVTLAGAANAVTTTNGAGAYAFADLPDGSYTVTPSLAGYTFSPASHSVTLAGADATGRNFTAAPVANPHAISGTVSGAVASGVTVTLSGAASAVTTTDGGGAYSFPGLADGSYTVTPSLGGYAFTPTSRNVNLSGADASGQDFAAAVSASPPAPPVAVAVFPGSNGVLVAWTPSPGATSYRVYAGSSTPVAQVNPVATTGSHSAAIGPYANGRRVFFAVSAVGPGGESGLAAPRCAVPTSAQASTSGSPLELWDPLCDDAFQGRRWFSPAAHAIEVINGRLELTANADDLEPRSLRNANASASVGVAASAGRVTTISSEITVPSGGVALSGQAVGRSVVRLVYQPPSKRKAPPWNADDNLVFEVGLVDAGSGLHVYRNATHCDTADCGVSSSTGIAFVDPPQVGNIPGSPYRGAPAAHDTPYRATARLDEATGIFHWTISGGAYGAQGISGTADPTAYLLATSSYATAPITGSGFWLAQLLSRVHDASLTGGSDGWISARFDNVQIGTFNGAAAPYDDFENAPVLGVSGQLSLARWGTGAAVVEPSLGALALYQAATSVGPAQGIADGLAISHPEQFDMFQADVLVSTATLPAGASAAPYLEARLHNNGGPAGAAPGNATGDVVANLSLNVGGAPTFTIRKCPDATCSGSAAFLTGSLPSVPVLNVTHALRVGYSRELAAFEFAVDGVTTTIPAPAGTGYGGPARAPRKQVFARVSVPAQAGSQADILAIVSNVSGRPDPGQGFGLYCNAIDPAGAASVTVMNVATASPAASATGGTIVPGTYRATAMNVYTGSGGASGAAGFTAQQTFVLGTDTLDYAGIVSDGTEKRQGRYGTSGANLVVVAICPTSGLKVLRYTVSGNTLTLHDGDTEIVLERQ